MCMCKYTSRSNIQSHFIGVQIGSSTIQEMHTTFSPLNTAPNWLSPPPQGAVQTLWSICPSVLIYYHAKKQAVNGGKKIFFATFLQAKKQAIDSLLYAWFL